MITTVLKPMPAADIPCYQRQTRLPAPVADAKPQQVATHHLLLHVAPAAMMFGLVLLAITGTAQAQNADLNTNADTVSGINAIPTNLPGSARTITGQPATSPGPVNLLELAKQHRQADQARTDDAAAQTDGSDFRLSSQYRVKASSMPGNANATGSAQNPDVIQASIMTSETDGSSPSAWTRTQPAQPAQQPQTQNTPQGGLTAPAITKPAVTAPTRPTVPQAQIVTPWGQTSQQAGDNNGNGNSTATSQDKASSPAPKAALAPPVRRTGNPLFAAPQPNGNTAPTVLPAGNNAPFPANTETQTQQQPAVTAVPLKAAQQQPPAPRPSPAAINNAPAMPKPANGNYTVQLGAFRSAIGAETYWASFAVRYPQLAKTYHHYLGSVDVAGKGQLHRLRMGGFASLEAAKEKCRQLQADGIDCIGLPK